MASTVWSGTVSFGLVSIPVKLYSAVSRKTVRFNQIDTRSGARVRQKRVSGDDGSEVAWSDIAKGYEQPDGQYVILTDEELSSVDVKATKTIEIEQFVDLQEIDPLAYDAAYNVVPDAATLKPYALLVEALESTGKVAVARFVMRAKQNLAALRAVDGRLVLSTMVYADELNDPREFEAIEAVEEVTVSEKERKIAESLVESLTEPWDPAAFTDTHREKVMELIARKADGATEIIKGEPVEEGDGKVVDLMAALEASIEQAKTARGRHPTSNDENEDDDEGSGTASSGRRSGRAAGSKAASRNGARPSARKAADTTTADTSGGKAARTSAKKSAAEKPAKKTAAKKTAAKKTAARRAS